MRPNLPLNALRAFESSSRHLSFTRAAQELNVTQAAVSQQVRALEERLGVSLFKRLPRGLAVTDEGLALRPVLSDAFDRIESVLRQFEGGHFHEVLTVGAVGTFAVGWLMPRLRSFHALHPFVELRLMTNNNLVDLAAEGLDCAIRFGDGNWPGTRAQKLFDAPLSLLCAPDIAQRLRVPADLVGETLLRSYRADDWMNWFAKAGLAPMPARGAVFDSSRLMVEAATQGAGVALAPASMFARDLATGRLVRPFDIEVQAGSYWLIGQKGKPATPAMQLFNQWIVKQAEEEGTAA
ncbi:MULTISPECIES: LysR family transcriptional regulator [Burkholderia]|jgi:LysR family transcriptional regulator of beta-lactamase|uniref:Bacterial regulatory helix-turn-helix, lysR family protein n=2 Tax=Burkholderia gladioli TaxID=28095 RepID=A0AAP1Y476_BURGA|nr:MULTISPECIES: LysR family transcriptional regulator [Burkholderia]AEA65084.1 LysR family transcriptional regulator [Burkholderia gladioli BSR3]AJW94026.1 bacterial regulatory helix-turn-helix, lysR family protein [Burkholderia gladioli]ASD83784.1 LysR family transcriptional regulator [Burkholderia gladioli pv. gladioli]AWY51208.1 LysR family transcriptional regulator [Burkholderia gladioli pv. gladioli]AYQ90518.1 transcriptional regulator GcvA [Burkholderia gladioli]